MILNVLKEFESSKNSKTRKLKTLYKLILNYGPIRTEALAEKANMKPATCARLLDELIKMQVICGAELGKSTGGRKPILYTVNASDGYLIGIELSNIYTTIVLLNLDLTILGMVKIKIETLLTINEMIDRLLPKIEQLLQEHGLVMSDLIGIGISVDHLLEQMSERVANIEQQISAIEQDLGKRTATYVTLGCGINFAALAEYRLHYTATSQRFVFTTCDTEIRSSAMINNRFTFTQLGAADAFGHVSIDIHGPACQCGSFGCLNGYSSLAAIKNKIIQQIRRGKPSQLLVLVDNIEQIDYHIIFQGIAMNDDICIAALEEAAYYYGIAIANMILTLQPDVVVCGGTLVPKSTFFAIVKQTIEDKIKMFPQLNPRIYAANDSYEIVAQGAGGMVLENLLK